MMMRKILAAVLCAMAVPLFAQGFMDGDRLTRDPAAPDLPTVGEVYRKIHGVDPSGSADQGFGRAFLRVGKG